MRSHQNMVFSTALRLTANASDAEDIAQEVFLRAYRHFGELRENPRAGGWLRTVATHLGLNHLSRYRKRWSFFSELSNDEAEDRGESPLNAAADADPDPFLESDRKEVLDHALQKLPASQRVPLVLFHMEGMSYEEIASRLGVSLAKVKTDIFRAREALRSRLQATLENRRIP